MFLLIEQNNFSGHYFHCHRSCFTAADAFSPVSLDARRVAAVRVQNFVPLLRLLN